MKRHCRILLCSLLFFFAALQISSGQVPVAQDHEVQADTSATSALMAKLDAYLEAMDGLSLQAACAECDFLIGSVQDETLRSTVAVKAYEHFRQSPLMGSETVAIHIFDRWFASYEALFDDFEAFEQAQVHAFVNRRSLIGEQAPVLNLLDIQGEEVTMPSSSRPALIFFYSASCPKCLYYATQIRDFLEGRGIYKGKGPKTRKFDLYTIYCGEDDVEWELYVRQHFKLRRRCGRRDFHLKGADSDFVTAYGVVQTPRLFFVGSDGKIQGRNLDVPSLRFFL